MLEKLCIFFFRFFGSSFCFSLFLALRPRERFFWVFGRSLSIPSLSNLIVPFEWWMTFTPVCRSSIYRYPTATSGQKSALLLVRKKYSEKSKDQHRDHPLRSRTSARKRFWNSGTVLLLGYWSPQISYLERLSVVAFSLFPAPPWPLHCFHAPVTFSALFGNSRKGHEYNDFLIRERKGWLLDELVARG